MKILVLGDIHGRLYWSDIISKENPDKVIFLGDYVSTHEGIPAEQQMSNLEDILNYKDENPDRVVLLRGNHDTQHLGYPWAECSGWDQKLYEMMKSRIDDYLNRFDDDKEIYMSDSLYKDACALVIIQMGEFANRFSDEFLEEYDGIEWGQLIGLRNVTAHNYENIIDDIR